jgi:hypothetical protein
MKGPVMTALVSRSLAILALLAATITLGGHARAATPTLEIINMTGHTATIVVDRAGLAYAHYTIQPYNKAMVYGDGTFTFTGTISVGPGVALPRRETTLVAGAKTRGLIIEIKGGVAEWAFGLPTSGAVM